MFRWFALEQASGSPRISALADATGRCGVWLCPVILQNAVHKRSVVRSSRRFPQCRMGGANFSISRRHGGGWPLSSRRAGLLDVMEAIELEPSKAVHRADR